MELYSNFHSTQKTGRSRAQALKAEALRYAQCRVPVFPLVPGGKAPVIPKCAEAKHLQLTGSALAEHALKCKRDGHGFHDATTDPRRINMWWHRWPDANIGIPTGARSSLIVLDVDAYKPGAFSLSDVMERLGSVARARMIQTGSGGLQLWFRYPEAASLREPGSLRNGIPE